MAIPTPPTDGRFRILVVEDDPHIARLICILITKAKMQVYHAPDGATGLSTFQSNNPHLVLTDIMLPNMNGRELCAKIRETSEIPIIMMTAASSEEGELHGFKVGADDYIPKPFNPQLMMARIVANLRRVYRYDFSEAKESAPVMPASAAGSAPSTWLTCDSCGYMGPREKFHSVERDGQSRMTCPNCKGNNVTFAVI